MFLNRAEPAGEEEGRKGILRLSWCGIIKKYTWSCSAVPGRQRHRAPKTPGISGVIGTPSVTQNQPRITTPKFMLMQ